MAVTVLSHRCNVCGGKLEEGVCLFCGSADSPDREPLVSAKSYTKEAILNISERQLDAAELNIRECEKMDAEYVGVLICKLCDLLMQATNPAADVRSVYAQINKNYKLLQQSGNTISGEEKALCRFIDNADAYAIMLLAYDGLNHMLRRDYILGLLRATEVQSPDLNRNLLNFAVKSSNYPMIDAIIANSSYLNTTHALSELLTYYPDNTQKSINIDTLLQSGGCTMDDCATLEQYIMNSGDAVSTKAKIISSALSMGLKPNVDFIISQILISTDYSTIKELLRHLCQLPLKPREFDSLLSFAFAHNNPDVAVAAVKYIRRSNQPAYASAETLSNFLMRTDFASPELKLQFLQELLQFVQADDVHAVLHHYLCDQTGNAEERLQLIPVLIDAAGTLSAEMITSYMLRCGTDDVYKRDIAAMLLCAELDFSELGDLASNYLLSTVDAPEIRTDIIILMQNYEMRLDPRATLQYICLGADPPATKTEVLRRLAENGTMIPPNAMSLYLEKSDLSLYYSGMLDVLAPTAGVITDAALNNYVLYCKEAEGIKVRRALKMAKMNGSPFGSTECLIFHAQQKVQCNLLQAYLLMTKDSYDVTSSLIDAMLADKAKFVSDITINGLVKEKYKRYLIAHKESLRSVSHQICEENKLFSKLFGS